MGLELDRGGGREVLEEPVVDLHHGRVHAGAQALDLVRVTVRVRGRVRVSQVRVRVS